MSLYLKSGDMVVFEDTGEVCVLIEQFDVWAENAEERVRQGQVHRPTWAWRTLWHPHSDGERGGPWQNKLEVGSLEDRKRYGIAAVNLYNSLSHNRAKRKGDLLRVSDRSKIQDSGK